MPILNASLSRDLHETNERLLYLLDRIAGEETRRRVVTPEEIAALLSELMRTGADLRSQAGAAASNPEFEQELRQYRIQVERLRDVLPTIHGQLLAERAGIQAQQARINSAAEWARASRETL